MEEQQMYNPFEELSFTYDQCFLCGVELSEQNRTDEHIYPKWLQNMFNLWNKELVLLNGTCIKYKDLKIPCCKSCNRTMGSLLEKPIERAVNGGYNEFITLDRNLIFLWLNKLSYGMLFKELNLDLSRKEPERGKILSEEYMKENETQYLFLQTILSNAKYAGNPYSMLIFKIDPCDFENYGAHDNPFIKTFFIRMNDIGIITHLMDNGFNEGYFLNFPIMEELTHKTLHPIQFDEICAAFLYKCSLFYRDPWYFMVMNEEKKPDVIISQCMSGDGFHEWSQKDYAKVLAFFWKPYGLDFNDIYNDDERVLSYLHGEDGSFFNLIDTFKYSDFFS